MFVRNGSSIRVRVRVGVGVRVGVRAECVRVSESDSA